MQENPVGNPVAKVPLRKAFTGPMLKVEFLEKAALAAIILGIVTGAKVFGGAINLRMYSLVVLAVFFLRLEFMAGIIGKNPRLWVSMFLFLIAGLASAISAINLEMVVKQLTLISTFMLVPLAMTVLIKKHPRNIEVSLFWLVVAGLIASVNGYLDPFYRYKSMGWVSAFGRPQSFFVEANEFGQFMVMMWGYLLAMVVLKSATKQVRFYGFLSALIMFPVFLINNSRGSYLGFALECMLLGWLVFKAESKRYFLKVVLMGSIILIGSLGVTYSVASSIETINGDTVADWIIYRMISFGGSEDETTNIRVEQQKSGYQAMLDHPWTGAGLGNIMYYLNDRIDLDNSGVQKGPTATTAFWLTDLLAETGIFGTTAVGLVLLVLVQQGYRNYKYSRGGPLECMAAGSFLSLTGMFLNGVSYPPIYLPFFWLNIGVCLQLSYLRETGVKLEVGGSSTDGRAAPAQGGVNP